MKKAYQLVGRKFIQETELYRSVPQRKRINQLKSILKQPKSGKYFQGHFPQFPLQFQWQYSKQKLRAVTWKPRGRPKALIVGYHCLNGHAGLSSLVAEQYSKMGYVFTSFDYPNFGEYQGKQKGHIQSMKELINCCQNFLFFSRDKYPNIPIFLFGYSLGGLMAFRVGEKNQSALNGCIFVNPSLQDNIAKNAYLKKIVMLISLFFPKFKTFKPSGGNSSKHFLQKYKEKDPLMYHGKLWVSTSANILTCMMQSRFMFSDFTLPYLYIQGGTDKTVNPFIAFDFEKETKSQDKETVIIHDLWHSVWFDDRLGDVITMSKQWIRQRI